MPRLKGEQIVTVKESPAVAIYVRKSNKTESDDEDGRSASVLTQLRRCREHAEAQNWTVVAEYEDNGISAVPGAKRRADFEQLLVDAEAGKFDTVMLYKADRLERNPETNERIIRVFRKSKVRVYALDSGWADPSRSGDRTSMRFRSVIGVTEVENLSDRVRDRAEQRALVERRLVASQRPFGWRWRKPCGPGPDCFHKTKCTESGKRPQQGTRAGLEPDPVEAPALAAAYADMAAGLSLHAAWKRLAASVEVGKMTSATLGTILRNPRNAGLVTYKGRIVGEAADGQKIVDPDLYDKVAAILNDPTRRTTPGRPAGTWLGGGILRCGRCGGPMSASNRHSRSGGGTTKAKVYICSRNLHLTRRRAAVDEAVLPLIADGLAELGARGLLAQAPGDDERAHTLREQIAGHQQTLDGLSTQLATGALHPADYAAATTKVRALMANLQAELSARAERPALAALADAADTRTSWGTLLDTDDHDTVRAVVGELVDEIVANTDRTLTVKWREFTGLEPTVLPPAEPRINGRQARRRKVADLHAQGLSISAIAAQVGCDRSTVRDDLKHAGL